MDSLNSISAQPNKADAEERVFRRKTCSRISIIAVSAFLLLLIAAAVIFIAIDSGNLAGKPVQLTPYATPVDSIKAVCSVTLYPDSCYSSISSARDPNATVENPEVVFKLSVLVALKAVSEAYSVPVLLSEGSIDSTVKAALRDCTELLSSAAGNLNETLAILNVGLLPKKIR